MIIQDGPIIAGIISNNGEIDDILVKIIKNAYNMGFDYAIDEEPDDWEYQNNNVCQDSDVATVIHNVARKISEQKVIDELRQSSSPTNDLEAKLKIRASLDAPQGIDSNVALKNALQKQAEYTTPIMTTDSHLLSELKKSATAEDPLVNNLRNAAKAENEETNLEKIQFPSELSNVFNRVLNNIMNTK